MGFELLSKSKICVFSLATALLVAMLTGCSGSEKKTEAIDTADSVKTPAKPEVFHVDTDIAMRVRSIVDAIKQGEALDTAIYNFNGILTDGAGAPIYTDAQGDPGKWKIRVTDEAAELQNLYLGDFVPDYVRAYIAEELDLTDDDVIKKGTVAGVGKEDVVNYSFDGGEIHFEVTKAKTADGKEGPLLTIYIMDEEKATLRSKKK